MNKNIAVLEKKLLEISEVRNEIKECTTVQPK